MENIKHIVSVVLPVYNAEKYLSTTIESVLNQTYSSIELIAINDCSTDSSVDILYEYQQKDSRIKIINLKLNSGVAVARNMGIKVAIGRYLAFIDSDDIWDKEKLVEQIKIINSLHCGFSFTAIEMIDENGLVIKKKIKIPAQVDYNYLLKNTVIATSTVLIDLSIIGKFEMPLLRSGQDYSTWLMLLRNGLIAYGIDSPLTKYRVLKNSLSSNKLKSIKQVFHIQHKIEGISILKTTYNTLYFIFNAMKKYFF